MKSSKIFAGVVFRCAVLSSAYVTVLPNRCRRRKKRRESRERTRTDDSQAGCALRRPPDELWLECEAERKVHARERCVAQVIHPVYLNHINVLRVEPVAGPRVNESERIATVLEAVIAVVGLGDTERVLLSKIGLEFVCRNAPATVTSGMLLLILRGRLAVLFLLGVLFFRLRVLLLLGRGFFFLLC